MLALGFWMALSLGFWGQGSWSLSDGVLALTGNPAGLAYQQSLDLLLFGAPESRRFWAGMAQKGFGFAYSEGIQRYAFAFPVLPWASLGGAVDWKGGLQEARIGALARPWSFLSLGLGATRNGGLWSYHGGLALKALDGRIALSGEGGWAQETLSWRVGVALEPLHGLQVFGEADQNRHFRLGAELRLRNFSLAAWRASETRASAGVRYTERVFRSFLDRPWVVEIRLDRSFPETPQKGFFQKETGFYELVLALEEIAQDPRVRGVWLDLGSRSGLSFAQAWEIRAMIRKLQNSGKWVGVWCGDIFTDTDYLLASAADWVGMIPTGFLLLDGLAAHALFFKGTLEKLGMEAQFEHIGEYKTAAEPLTRDSMSRYHREQLSAYLDDLYRVYGKALEERGVIPDSILTQALFSAHEAVERGLLDGAIFRDERDSLVEKTLGKNVRWISLATYRKSRPYPDRWEPLQKPRIALILAEGAIAMGENRQEPLQGKIMGEKTIVEAFRAARKDKRTKAVVFRVNSPGGLATASDAILRELKLTAEKKPVIVSMGAVAASGGYYISCGATKIVASPVTLTGSIGILGGKLVISGFLEKIGVNVQTLRRGPHADALSSFRPFTEEERQGLRKLLRAGYEDFLERVAEGRGLSADSVDAIGRGRIWSGLRAKEIGLVDTLGGLALALELARKAAGLSPQAPVSWRILPRPKGLFFPSPLAALMHFRLTSPLSEPTLPYQYRLPLEVRVEGR